MLIRSGALALPGEKDFVKRDLLVREGRIAAILQPGCVMPEETAIDARGLLVFPGAIDPHVHFDEPGFTHREDFAHGTAEAARGGVTTVIDMPCTSLPPVTSVEAFENKRSIIAKSALVDYAFYGGVCGLMSDARIKAAIDELSPFVVGFKCYTISGMETFTAVSKAQFARAMAACASAGRPLLLHAESPGIIGEATGRLAAARGTGVPGWADYYRSRPPEAEIEACAEAVRLAGGNAHWLHIVHVGTSRAAELATAAGASCETCAHYLAFDENDFDGLGASLKTAPPVKGPGEKALLWRQLASGIISFVASDHAGAPEYEKETGNPLTAYGGIPGTGTLFPYLLSEGLFAKRLSLPRFLEAAGARAAERYGLSGAKGSLEVGKDADFVLIDPESTTLIDPAHMRSKSTITPFAGFRLSGRIRATYVRGELVCGDPERSRGASPGWGKLLTWGYR